MCFCTAVRYDRRRKDSLKTNSDEGKEGEEGNVEKKKVLMRRIIRWKGDDDVDVDYDDDDDDFDSLDASCK